MKRIVFIALWCIVWSQLSGQVRFDNTTPQTAMKYYEEREFSKAAPLFREIYAVTGQYYYFRYYIQCLTELKDYEQAENEIKKESRKARGQQPELLIQYGYLLKVQKMEEEALVKYGDAMRSTPSNKNNFINTANTFLQFREYEWAEKVYLQGQKVLPGEDFTLELAQIHLMLRNYTLMMEELLDGVKKSEENLPRVQSMLNSALYLDIENSLRDEFRKLVLKRIQSEPGITGYSRLLIWFYLQEKQFSAALRQVIALDRRTNREVQQIISFAQMALNNHFYEDAAAAYDYILSKGKDNSLFFHATYYKIHAAYLSYADKDAGDTLKARSLADEFGKGLELLGYNASTLTLIREYAHLLSFYLNDQVKAIAVLERGIKIPMLKPEQAGELKAELGDVYINAGDPWEATLLYAQVIDANRENALGDDVKFKKARLGYLMGNFSWAKAQLDVLKASTSKLTANDAMELSLFIGNNAGLDSTEAALYYFARADLHFFRNRDEEAVQTLDSILTLFPYDALIDDILLRKAKIEIRRNQFENAVKLLDQVIRDYSWDLLADDALFMEAEIYHYKLNDKEKALEAYRRILFDYSGSIYVSEARKRYRELKGTGSENEQTLLHIQDNP